MGASLMGMSYFWQKPSIFGGMGQKTKILQWCQSALFAFSCYMYLSETHQWRSEKLLGIENRNTYTQPFLRSLDFVQDKPGEPVPEKTFILSHPSCSSVIPYLLPPSITIHDILLDQFTCLTVFFHNLSPSFFWSTSWPGTLHFILHTFLNFFTQSLSFCSTCPYHRNLFCFSTDIVSSNPSLSLKLYMELHLCTLKCHLIFLSYSPRLTSVQHTTLHTTAVQSPSHCQWYILIGLHTASSVQPTTIISVNWGQLPSHWPADQWQHSDDYVL